jgi:hypothetical protein
LDKKFLGHCKVSYTLISFWRRSVWRLGSTSVDTFLNSSSSCLKLFEVFNL